MENFKTYTDLLNQNQVICLHIPSLTTVLLEALPYPAPTLPAHTTSLEFLSNST